MKASGLTSVFSMSSDGRRDIKSVKPTCSILHSDLTVDALATGNNMKRRQTLTHILYKFNTLPSNMSAVFSPSRPVNYLKIFVAK